MFLPRDQKDIFVHILITPLQTLRMLRSMNHTGRGVRTGMRYEHLFNGRPGQCVISPFDSHTSRLKMVPLQTAPPFPRPSHAAQWPRPSPLVHRPPSLNLPLRPAEPLSLPTSVRPLSPLPSQRSGLLSSEQGHSEGRGYAPGGGGEEGSSPAPGCDAGLILFLPRTPPPWSTSIQR